MEKNVIVLSTSLRANSNSERLAQKFYEGAIAAGHKAEMITLKDKTIHFCKGCLACQETGNCPMQDDVKEIMEKVINADVVAWATPIYYYEMSGQMKTLIDRMNPMFPKDYKFRDIYFLATAAEDEESVYHRALEGLQGWIDCYEKASLKGYVFCGGVTMGGEIHGNDKLQTAYDLGENIE